MSRKIPNQEYEERLSKIQNLLRSNELAGLFCTLGVNFRYLLKSKAEPSERLTMGIITPDGLPEIICPAFEVSNIRVTTPVSEDRIHPWEETENPFTLLADVSRTLNIDDATLALSPGTAFTTYVKIRDALPRASFKDAFPVFKTARVTKTEMELELLQEANKLTARAIETTFDQLEEGMTEKEVAMILERELTSRSGEQVQFAAVQFGVNSPLPHHLPGDKKLQRNEVVLIDAGTTVEGYIGDITNTTVFGKPSEKFLEIYDCVEEAQLRAVESAHAGAIPEEVDAVARDYLTSKGYGQYFTHRTGHGIGLEVHEDPYIVRGNLTPLERHHVFSIEPGVYIQGKFGIRIEDAVISAEKSGKRTCNPVRRYWEKA
ncbi:MAG: aminopeptidase P family protein [Candidatus Odinarchaeota archaeon]